jgi:hypothetical protein
MRRVNEVEVEAVCACGMKSVRGHLKPRAEMHGSVGCRAALLQAGNTQTVVNVRFPGTGSAYQRGVKDIPAHAAAS